MAKNVLGPQIEAMARIRTKQLVAEQTKARLCMGMDAAILAAHEVFGLGPGRAAAFRDAYLGAMEELATLFIDDAEGDVRLEYAKAKRDEAEAPAVTVISRKRQKSPIAPDRVYIPGMKVV